MTTHSHFDDVPCSKASLKACDAEYVQWQAWSQVLLAARIVDGWSVDERARWRHDDTIFGQLVRVLANEHSDIFNKHGNPSQNPYVKRLRGALDRYRRETSDS